MNLSVLVPQLFYDLIARMIPGATLTTCAFILIKGPAEGTRYLTAWSDNTMYVIIGNLLAFHILGTLLGGLWFRIYRLDLLNDSEKVCKHSKKIKWLHGWAKNGELRLDDAFTKIFRYKMPALGDIELGKINSTSRMALIYDYIQLRCPRDGARIAKLRAEQHMSGVLMIGFILISIILLVCKMLSISLVYENWSLILVEIALLFSALNSGWLAWHLEKRAGSASFFLWYLVWSGIAKEDNLTD